MKYYPNGFKLDYSIFVELYELQPELFVDKINFDNFKNYNENINEVKRIYQEFHEIYSNSSFQGTKYHTNVMINRNQFLYDYDSKYKFFTDDDDFTCGLENYYRIYQEYENIINEFYKVDIPTYKLLFKILNLNINVPNIINNEFRKNIREIFTIQNMAENIYVRYLYVIYTKCCIFETRFMYKRDNKYTLRIKSFSECNKIIPPYLPFNFTMIQESASEDCAFTYIHYSNISLNNVLNYNFNTYYYFNAACNNYVLLDKKSSFTINRYNTYKMIIGSNIERYTPLNIGRYYYKFDSIVEFINCNNIEELRFVCDKQDRKIKSGDIKDINDWNDKLSREYLGVFN